MTFRLLKFCPRRGNKQKKVFSGSPNKQNSGLGPEFPQRGGGSSAWWD